MYKHCNTEDSARRQRQLEQCLLKLMADTPFANITIQDICKQCGISRKSFYRYFDSKEGCLHALLDHTIMDGVSFYMPDTGHIYSDLSFCIRIFEYWQQQTPLLDVLEKNGQSMQLLQRIIRYILTEEPEYARYMGIPQEQTMEHIVYHIGGLMGLILTWHHGHYQKTAAQMGEVLYQMLHHRQD